MSLFDLTHHNFKDVCMTKQRYHAHLIAVSDHHPELLSDLHLHLADEVFFTQDVPRHSPRAASYSRQCIDECDLAIMLLLGSYGEPNATGVSQLHLSYLIAKTKQKPILILVKSPSADSTVSRQLSDFIDMVEERDSQHIYYFSSEIDFEAVLADGYRVVSNGLSEQAGWQKVADNQSLHALAKFSSFTNISTFSPPSKEVTADGVNLREQLLASSTLSDLEQLNLAKGSDTKKATIDKSINQNQQQLDNPSHVHPFTASTASSLPTSLHEEFTIGYNAHAYQHGNLKHVHLTTTTTWQQVLDWLNELNETFSTDAIYRKLNDMVAKTAMQQVTKMLPMAHAVSNCQINQADFDHMLEQLQAFDWLEQTALSRSSRPLWQLKL